MADVGRVGIKEGRCAANHGRCAASNAARSARGGASPRGGPSPSVYNLSVIIYGVVTVTNNYTKIEGPAPGRSPPREQSEQRDWRRNARGWRRNAYA